MRAMRWAATGALVLATAVSCLDRAPSHRANAQAQAAPSAAEKSAAKEQAAPSAPEASAQKEQAPAASAPKPAAAGEKAAEKTTHEVILEHADRVHYDNKSKEYAITGDVVLRHEDGVLRAQSLHMNSETKKGVATGDLSFADQQTVVTADRLEIDFDARIGVFKGDVRMVTQRKPEKTETKGEAKEPGAAAPAASQPKDSEAQAQPASETKNAEAKAAPAGAAAKEAGSNGTGEEVKPFKEYWEERTEIRCPELEYFYREHRAVARKGITARQKDRTGRADEAQYTDDDEMLVLSGNVEMKTEKGETFHAKKVTISIAQDWLEAEGITGSRFLVEEKEGEKGKAGEEKAKAGEAKAKAGEEKPKSAAGATAPSKPEAGQSNRAPTQ